MPQVVPSTGQYVGQGLGQITEAIGNLLNPNKRFQDSVLEAITRDPSLIQKFADFEAGSPGILGKLGIPALGGVAPTPEAEFTAKNRGDIQKQKQGDLKNKITLGQLDADKFERVLALMKARPELGIDQAMMETVGQREAQRIIEQEQANAAPAQTSLIKTRAEVEKARAPGEIAQAELMERGFQIAQTMVNEGPDVTYEKFQRREYNNGHLMAVMATPFKDVLLMQQRDELERLQREAQVRGDNTSWERLLQQQAFNVWTQTGGVGSIQGMHTYMFGGGQQQASTLASQDETSLSPEEREQVAIHKALGAVQQIKSSEKRTNSFLKLNTALSGFDRAKKEGDPGQLQLHAQLINGILAEIGAPFSAFYGKSGERGVLNPFGGNEDLRFRNAKGETVQLKDVNKWFTSPPTEQTTGSAEIPERFKAAVDAYKALKTDSERAQALAKTRGSLKDRPKDLEELEKLLGVRK